MGELARFEGIRIKMYPMDTQKHNEPHFREEIWDRWNKAVAGEYIEKIEPKQI